MASDKSDLDFINLLRAIPIYPLNAPRHECNSLKPLHQGVEGKEHHLAKKKQARLMSVDAEPVEPSLEEQEEAEIMALMRKK